MCNRVQNSVEDFEIKNKIQTQNKISYRISAKMYKAKF